MNKFKRIIFSGKDELSSCAFPGICQLKNGRIFASFRGAKKKGPYNKNEKVIVCISDDNGNTWSEPKEIFESPIVEGKPTTLRTCYFAEISQDNILAVVNAVDASCENLPYYNEETEGLKNTYIMVSHSYDSGETWTQLERVQIKKFCDMPLPLTGAPFVTSEGRICIQFEVNKPYYSTEYWVHHSVAAYSDDGGHTWGNEVVITDNPMIYYWDQRIDILSDGTITDLFWTFDRQKGDYINIHYCQSIDGGRTFGELIDTGLSGQPGNVISPKAGELLAVYINRDDIPEIRLAQSTDEGKSWNDIMTVYRHERKTGCKQNESMNDVWAEMSAFSVGHPYIRQMNDGSLWVYYYCGPDTHRTDFCCTVLGKDIMGYFG